MSSALTKLEEQLLLDAIALSEREQRLEWSEQDIRDGKFPRTSPTIVEATFRSLYDKKVLLQFTNPHANQAWRLTPTGKEEAERLRRQRQISEPYASLGNAVNQRPADAAGDTQPRRDALVVPIGALTVTTSLDAGTARGDDIPASDRFVPISHNSEQILEAREALENAATEIIQSNELPLNADERNAISTEIRTLVSMLQERMVRLAQIQFAVSAQGTLGYLKNKFPDHAVGALIGKAIEAILKSLGLG